MTTATLPTRPPTHPATHPGDVPAWLQAVRPTPAPTLSTTIPLSSLALARTTAHAYAVRDILRDPWTAEGMHELVYYLRRYQIIKPATGNAVDAFLDIVWTGIYGHSEMTEAAKRTIRAALVEAIVAADRAARTTARYIGREAVRAAAREAADRLRDRANIDLRRTTERAEKAARDAAARGLTAARRRVLSDIARAAAREAAAARRDARRRQEELDRAERAYREAQEDTAASTRERRRAEQRLERARRDADRADRDDTPRMSGFPSKREWERIFRRTIIPAVEGVWDDAYSRIVQGINRRENARHKREARGDYSRSVGDRLEAFYDNALRKINNLVKGIENKERLRRRLEELRHADGWEGQIELMTRTQVTTAINSGSLAAALQQEEELGTPFTKTWVSVLDDRVRHDHRVAHGQSVPLNQPFRVGGHRLQFPGDPSGPPGQVINCRCVMRVAPTPVPKETRREAVNPDADVRDDPIPEPASLTRVMRNINDGLRDVIRSEIDRALRVPNVTITDRDIAALIRRVAGPIGTRVGRALIETGPDTPETLREIIAEITPEITREVQALLNRKARAARRAVPNPQRIARRVADRSVAVVVDETTKAMTDRLGRLAPAALRTAINIARALLVVASANPPTHPATSHSPTDPRAPRHPARSYGHITTPPRETSMATPTEAIPRPVTTTPAPDDRWRRPGHVTPRDHDDKNKKKDGPDVVVNVNVNPATGKWRGVLGVMDQWSSDMRMLAAPPDYEPIRSRPLPLPLLVQSELAPGHDKGVLGIGRIDRVWSDGNRIMGEGQFDMNDPVGAELARKVGEGYIRFVSLDVDEATEEMVPVTPDGTVIPDADPTSGEYNVGRRFPRWRVMGATLLAYPAFPDAFIALADRDHDDDEDDADDVEEEIQETERVTDDGNGCVVPDTTSGTGWVRADCDTDGALPANADGTGPAEEVVDSAMQASRIDTPTGMATDTTLTLAVDADTPWAPRDRAWDGAAAANRVTEWATSADEIDPDRMSSAFLVVDGPPQNKGSYKFGVADVIDGGLRLVWNGVTAAYAALQGARTPTTISDEQRTQALNKVRELYRSAARAFDDDSILESEAAQMATTASRTFEAEDQGNGCVCPSEDEDGQVVWNSCNCEEDNAVAADADGQPITKLGDDSEPAYSNNRSVIVASASVDKTYAPGWRPGGALFADPQLTEPTPIAVDPDTGRIVGHVATWGTCHVGYPKPQCITPPHSATDYSYFHTAQIPTDSGPVDVGVITMDTGHAELHHGAASAVAHYDNTGTQAAVIRVGEDAHGIWVAGTALPFLNDEERLRLSLARFSGDWRSIRGGAEMVAVLAVNTPGFPVPARRTGPDQRPYSLVAAGALAAPERPADTAVSAVDPKSVADLVLAELDRRDQAQRRLAALRDPFAALRTTMVRQKKERAAAAMATLSGGGASPLR